MALPVRIVKTRYKNSITRWKRKISEPEVIPEWSTTVQRNEVKKYQRLASIICNFCFKSLANHFALKISTLLERLKEMLKHPRNLTPKYMYFLETELKL